MTDHLPSISRRTVAKGLAWTAPVVVAAGAAPSLAASPGDPPVATTTQITIDSGHAVGEWGVVRVTGRAPGDRRPVDGALPPGTFFTLTPTAGSKIVIDPEDQVGIAEISGPDGSNSYRVTPVDGQVNASLYITTDAPGTVTVEVFGPAGDGQSGTGTWV